MSSFSTRAASRAAQQRSAGGRVASERRTNGCAHLPHRDAAPRGRFYHLLPLLDLQDRCALRLVDRAADGMVRDNASSRLPSASHRLLLEWVYLDANMQQQAWSRWDDDHRPVYMRYTIAFAGSRFEVTETCVVRYGRRNLYPRKIEQAFDRIFGKYGDRIVRFEFVGKGEMRGVAWSGPGSLPRGRVYAKLLRQLAALPHLSHLVLHNALFPTLGTCADLQLPNRMCLEVTGTRYGSENAVQWHMSSPRSRRNIFQITTCRHSLSDHSYIFDNLAALASATTFNMRYLNPNDVQPQNGTVGSTRGIDKLLDIDYTSVQYGVLYISEVVVNGQDDLDKYKQIATLEQ